MTPYSLGAAESQSYDVYQVDGKSKRDEQMMIGLTARILSNAALLAGLRVRG